MNLKFFLYRYYWLSLPIYIVAALALTTCNGPIDFKVLSAVMGGFLSLVYFVQKQRLEEVKLFRDIFRECNERYDNLNEKLNAIIKEVETKELSNTEKNTLDDYFNLCSEEFLYKKQGYIYPDVWESWNNGMKTIFHSPRVWDYWQVEKISNSYYGLPL